jgi:hypothetical protein
MAEIAALMAQVTGLINFVLTSIPLVTVPSVQRYVSMNTTDMLA